MNPKNQSFDDSSLRRDAIPLFVQLASLMRRRIVNGDWPPGFQIPTVEQLANEFSVSRVTVRQAAERLENEGLIWRHRGKGTFVRDHTASRRKLTTNASWDSMIEFIEGIVPEVLFVSETAEPLIPPFQEGHPAPAYRTLRRVHRKKGTPYSAIDIHLDERIYQTDPERICSNTILPIIAAMPDVVVAKARQELNIGSADARAAKDLETTIGTPVCEISTVVIDRDDTVIYFATFVLRADMLRIDINYSV